MNKLILLAIVAVVVGQSVHQLTLGSSYSGTLSLEDYNEFYVDYPENTTYLQIDWTVSTTSTSDCYYLYMYSNMLSFPCASEPSSMVTNSYDPCYDNVVQSQYLSTTPSTETYYIFPGSYDDLSYSFDYLASQQSGRVFFSVNKNYESDTNCAFSVKVSAGGACNSALGANNGVAVGHFSYNYFEDLSDAPAPKCEVYTNITLQNDTPVYTQITSAPQGEIVYKTMIPKNAAYINITLTGVESVASSSSLYVYATPRVAVNTSDSDLGCYSSDYFDSTSLNASITLTCTLLYPGAMYIVIVIPSASSGTTYFNGTLTTTLHVCPEGTATGYSDYLNCQASNFVDISPLFNSSVGVVNFTNVPVDTYKTGWFDWSQTMGQSFTLNFTGSSPSSSSAYMYVALYMNHQEEDNHFSTSYTYGGLSFSGYDTDSRTFFNITNARIYVSYYCYSGPCTSQIFLGSAGSAPTPSPPTPTPPTPGPPSPTPTPTPTPAPASYIYVATLIYADTACKTLFSVSAFSLETSIYTNCNSSFAATNLTCNADATTGLTTKRQCYTSADQVKSAYLGTTAPNAYVTVDYGTQSTCSSNLDSFYLYYVGVCFYSSAINESIRFETCSGTTLKGTEYSDMNCTKVAPTNSTANSTGDCDLNQCCATEGPSGETDYVKSYCLNGATPTPSPTPTPSKATTGPAKATTGPSNTTGKTTAATTGKVSASLINLPSVAIIVATLIAALL